MAITAPAKADVPGYVVLVPAGAGDIRYIDTQEAHHRKRTFEQEYLALLENMAYGTISIVSSIRCRAYGAQSSLYPYPYPPLTQVG